MARGDDIEDRLIAFAVRVIHLCGALPNIAAGKHVRGQLLRSGTSPAANYGEARGAESGKDFVHKLRIVLKELLESRIWIKIIIQAEMLPEERMGNLLDECNQLGKIINSSIQTASAKTKR